MYPSGQSGVPQFSVPVFEPSFMCIFDLRAPLFLSAAALCVCFLRVECVFRVCRV